MNPNIFNRMEWWEKFLYCCFGTKTLREYTYRSVLFVPILVSMLLQLAGFGGRDSCIISLIILAIYTSCMLWMEHIYDTKVSSKL